MAIARWKSMRAGFHYLLGLVILLTLLLGALFLVNVKAAMPYSLPPACQSVQPLLAAPPDSTAMTIEVGGRAIWEFCWRVYAALPAAKEMRDKNLQIKPTVFGMTNEAYTQMLERLASDRQLLEQSPDILHVTPDLFQRLVEQNVAKPLDRCIQSHPEFRAIRPELWEDLTYKGQIYGIPAESGVTLFYFNKKKLHELNWSQEAIDTLPQRIQQGLFTLDDMLLAAQGAINAGVIEPGFGYWPDLDEGESLQLIYAAYGGHVYQSERDQLQINPTTLAQTYGFYQQLLLRKLTLPGWVAHETVRGTLDQALWEDSIVHGRVLFWSGHNFYWGFLTSEYRDDWVKDALAADEIGYALHPAGTANRAGVMLQNRTNFYIIPNKTTLEGAKADAVCALLAEMITPQILAHHTEKSGFLSPLLQSEKSEKLSLSVNESPAVAFQNAIANMWQYRQPVPYNHADYQRYLAILYSFMVQSKEGTLSTEVAANLAIQQLRRELEDRILLD